MNVSNLFVCMATVLKCSNVRFAVVWLNKMKIWSLAINLFRWFHISVNTLIKKTNLEWQSSKNWNQLIIINNICHSSSLPLQPCQVQRLSWKTCNFKSCGLEVRKTVFGYKSWRVSLFFSFHILLVYLVF